MPLRLRRGLDRYAADTALTPDRLSLKQSKALEKAREHGALLRWPNGIWSHADVNFDRGRPAWRCATGTVKSLVDRGLLRYTEWKPAYPYRMPIKAEPVESAT